MWTTPSDLPTPGETPLLYGVDPYDHTAINRRHSERLSRREVAHLRTQRLQPDQVAMLDKPRPAHCADEPQQPARYLLFNRD